MLVRGQLTAADYLDGSAAATSTEVETLRQKIACVEDKQLTADYHDPAKRTIANALTVELDGGETLEEVLVEAPLGHRLRREEAKPEIMSKYERHLRGALEAGPVQELLGIGGDYERLVGMEVDEYMDHYHRP